MGKRKVTYKTNEKPRHLLVLTGRIFLQYVDDEIALEAQKGDLLVFANNEALHTTHLGEYERTGFTGYFKVDVSDGKIWQPLIINEVFKNRENHFCRTERPIDTYNLCCETLRALAGKTLLRTYREHYELIEE
jgi:hypothetical protein